MKYVFRTLTVLLVLIAVQSCEYETIVPAKITKTNISFSTDIQPVLTEKCVSCHSGLKPVLKDGEAYNNLNTGGYINTTDPASSLFYEKISSGSMKPYTTVELTQYVLQWITEGAQDN